MKAMEVFMKSNRKTRIFTRRCTVCLLTLALSFSTLSAHTYAYDSPVSSVNTRISDRYDTVDVFINGRDTGYCAYIIENGVTYMPLRTIAGLLLPDADVYWDYADKSAVVSSGTLTLRARLGDFYITANGRYLALSGLYPGQNILINGTTYVPLRTAVRAFGGEIYWNGAEKRVEITSGGTPIVSGERYYDKDELYWLSRIIYAEAGDQSLRGQIAVGSVIMNRLRSKDFPNTIYGVIFDKKYGVQFTPTVNGSIYKTPSAESIIAAKLVLDGCSVSSSALYFLDPSIATSFWITENRTALFTIGCHDFYS
ncbi:MAG: cell wall hydrolase [Eubacteriales bacterium]